MNPKAETQLGMRLTEEWTRERPTFLREMGMYREKAERAERFTRYMEERVMAIRAERDLWEARAIRLKAVLEHYGITDDNSRWPVV